MKVKTLLKNKFSIFFTGFLAVVFVLTSLLDSQSLIGRPTKNIVAKIGNTEITFREYGYSIKRVQNFLYSKNTSPKAVEAYLNNDLWQMLQYQYGMLNVLNKFRYQVPKSIFSRYLHKESGFTSNGVFQTHNLLHYLDTFQIDFNIFSREVKSQIANSMFKQTFSQINKLNDSELASFEQFSEFKGIMAYQYLDLNKFSNASFKTTTKELKDYYEKNKVQFVQKEHFKLSYFLINQKTHNIKPSQKELEAFYQNHLDRYENPETVQVQRLLLQEDPGNTLTGKEISMIKKYQTKDIDTVINNVLTANGKGFRLLNNQYQLVLSDLPIKIRDLQNKDTLFFKEGPKGFSIYVKKKVTPAAVPKLASIKQSVLKDFVQEVNHRDFQTLVDQIFDNYDQTSDEIEQIAKQYSIGVETTDIFALQDFEKLNIPVDRINYDEWQDDGLLHLITISPNQSIVIQFKSRIPEQLQAFEDVKDIINAHLKAEFSLNLMEQYAIRLANNLNKFSIRDLRKDKSWHFDSKLSYARTDFIDNPYLPFALAESKNNSHHILIDNDKRLLVFKVFPTDKAEKNIDFINEFKSQWNEVNSSILLTNLISEDPLVRYDTKS